MPLGWWLYMYVSCSADLATVDIFTKEEEEEARSNKWQWALCFFSWFVTSPLAGGGGYDMCGLFILSSYMQATSAGKQIPLI